MFETPKSFKIEDEEGLMNDTFSLRLPKRVEPMLKELSNRGIKVGPKLRPYITEMVETLYKDFINFQGSRNTDQAS